MSDYRPAEYWERRLEGEFSLRGTGHLDYGHAYNEWLYRAKRRALGRALRRTDQPVNALDIGSGVGWVVAELDRRGIRVEGCDIAPVAIERLQARFPEQTFFPLALGEDFIPRDDASFDLVTALDVTYHVTDDSLWRGGLADIARVLRPRGSLIVIDGLGEHEVVPAEHVRFRSLEKWSDAAAAAGLEVDAVIPCYRWISRARGSGPLSRVPDGTRGALEYALELLVPRRPHMRCAVLRRAARSQPGTLV